MTEVRLLKKKLIGIPLVCIILFTIITSTISVYSIDNNIVPIEITKLQLEAQVNLFKKALDKFGATDPMETVDLYVLGFKERNGALQYAVFCDSLKQNFIKEMGEPSKSYYIIGDSSPWLQDYRVLENKKINDQTYVIKIKLHWVASGNYNEYEQKTLTVIKEMNKWCITNIK